MDIQVIKRDGHVEDFNLEKIKRVVVAAGLTQEKAVKLVESLQKWASGQLENISSLTIRDRVLLELKTLDPYAANMFEWYQKTKDKHK